MKKKRRESLAVLYQRARQLERSFIEMCLDQKVSPVFVDEFLSSIRSFNQRVELMMNIKGKDNEEFWQEGNAAMGKLNRILASLRLLDVTKKLSAHYLSNTKQEVLSLQKEMHELIRNLDD